MRFLLSLAAVALAAVAWADDPHRVAKGEKITLKITVPEAVQYAKWQGKDIASAENTDWSDPLHPGLTITGLNPGTDVLWIVMPHAVGQITVEVTGDDPAPAPAAPDAKNTKFPGTVPVVDLKPVQTDPKLPPKPAPAPAAAPAPKAPALPSVPAPAATPPAKPSDQEFPITAGYAPPVRRVVYPAAAPVARNVRTPSPFVLRPSPASRSTAANSTPLPASSTGRGTAAQRAETPLPSNTGNYLKWPEEPTPMYARGTVRSGGTMRAGGSG